MLSMPESIWNLSEYLTTNISNISFWRHTLYTYDHLSEPKCSMYLHVIMEYLPTSTLNMTQSFTVGRYGFVWKWGTLYLVHHHVLTIFQCQQAFSGRPVRSTILLENIANISPIKLLNFTTHPLAHQVQAQIILRWCITWNIPWNI